MYPLSFSEFASTFEGGRDEAWKQYAAYGGLPFILSCRSDEQRASCLEGLFENLYTKDLKERYRIRDERALDHTINILASSIGSLTNPEKLTGEFGRRGLAVSASHTVGHHPTPTLGESLPSGNAAAEAAVPLRRLQVSSPQRSRLPVMKQSFFVSPPFPLEGPLPRVS